MSQPRYVVVTPARNEQENIGLTISSMVAQECLPDLWVIVNDGSTDDTGNIVEEAAKCFPWIRVVHRSDRGFRKQGGGVVDTFNDGYKLIAAAPWEFLVKFDADLSFKPDFFLKCFEKFAEDPKIGIGGGLICHSVGGELVRESTEDPPFHVRGATKIYRRPCWQEIGGLVAAPGWDTIDELKANMLGWKTLTFESVKLSHHRPTGGASGSWNDWLKNGLANYITGYDPVFMACKCLRRSLRPPYLNGLGLWIGFIRGYLRRTPQVDDPELIKYLRHQQWRALTLRRSFWR
jgi:biofilm PGA synthesis N-glycosyltransferase PgaC